MEDQFSVFMSRSVCELQARGSISITFYSTCVHTGNVINRLKNTRIFVREIPETTIEVLFKTTELELAPHSCKNSKYR
jgi:hypothetical protein